MMFTAAATLIFASTAYAADSPSLRSRSLTAPDPRCATSATCKLYNLDDPSTSYPLGTSVVTYDPFSSSKGFSIGCTVSGGKTEYVKFFDVLTSSEISTQYFSPETYDDASDQTFWMDGDNDGARVNAVELFGECGEKTIFVSFHTWYGADEFPCVEVEYKLDTDSPRCDPPTKAPTKAPTKTPTMAPTKAPVKPPTKAPVKPPTKAPVKPPTKAPVNPPTKAPVKPPTKAPVQPPSVCPASDICGTTTGGNPKYQVFKGAYKTCQEECVKEANLQPLFDAGFACGTCVKKN